MSSCKVERRVTAGVGTSKGTRVQPCGIPLYSDLEVETGTCKSCRRGWTHPENYPTDKGLEQIRIAELPVPVTS